MSGNSITITRTSATAIGSHVRTRLSRERTLRNCQARPTTRPARTPMSGVRRPESTVPMLSAIATGSAHQVRVTRNRA